MVERGKARFNEDGLWLSSCADAYTLILRMHEWTVVGFLFHYAASKATVAVRRAGKQVF